LLTIPVVIEGGLTLNDDRKNESPDDDIIQGRRDVRGVGSVGGDERRAESGRWPAEAGGDSKADDGDHKGAGWPEAIPRFDLAGQIMAEQRRITAATRKAPGEKPAPRDDGEDFRTGRAEADSVIVEIVARDIAEMLRL